MAVSIVPLAPSRAIYERVGFQRWPVARYFREL